MLVLPPVKSLYEGWKQINEEFLNPEVEHLGMLIPNRDFSRIIPNVRITSEGGFGLPKILPPFFANYSRRLDLLGARYIDEDLMDLAINRLIARRTRMARSNPMSFVIPFHRRPTPERKVPAGGGCLQTITFIWVNGRWQLHVLLRASEITARLIADIVFVRSVVRTVVKAVDFKKWDPKTEIIWDIALASQMKYMVPVFYLYAYGDEKVREQYMNEEPDSPWRKAIWEHFWDTFIHPERITWQQRRKWSEKFLEATRDTDWHSDSRVREKPLTSRQRRQAVYIPKTLKEK